MLLLLGSPSSSPRSSCCSPSSPSAATGRSSPASGSSALYFACARARLHVLRDHADPAAHALPRLPDVLAHRHARVAPLFTGVGALLSGRHPAARPRALPVPARRDRRAHRLLPVRPAADHRRAPRSRRSPSACVVAFLVLAPARALPRACSCRSASARSPSSSRTPREYVAWGWAVNGFASVVGAVLTTILAMTFGFNIVLVFALVAYLIAIVTLRSLLTRAGSPSRDDQRLSLSAGPTAGAPRAPGAAAHAPRRAHGCGPRVATAPRRSAGPGGAGSSTPAA